MLINLTDSGKAHCVVFSLVHLTHACHGEQYSVTADETLVNYTTLKTKIVSLVWKQPSSPIEKRFKAMPSMRESAAVSCNLECVLVVTLTAELYCGAMSRHLLQNSYISAPLHNNARLQTANWT